MSMHLAAWCTHHHPLHLAPSIHPQTPPPATNSTPHPRPPPPPHLLLRAAIPPLLLEPLHPRRLLRRLLLVVLPQRLCLQPLLLFLQLPLALHHRREGGKERRNGSWRATSACARLPARMCAGALKEVFACGKRSGLGAPVPLAAAVAAHTAASRPPPAPSLPA